jgi:hypothetical protein
MFRFLARGRTKYITSADEVHFPFDGRERYCGVCGKSGSGRAGGIHFDGNAVSAGTTHFSQRRQTVKWDL